MKARRVQNISFIYRIQGRNLRINPAVLFCILLSIVLILLPAEGSTADNGTGGIQGAVALVTKKEPLTVRILTGSYSGSVTEAGISEPARSLFEEGTETGELLLVSMEVHDNKITGVQAADSFRLDTQLTLGIISMAGLLLLTGRKKITSILMLFPSILFIWKILLPAWERGISPALTGLLVSIFLSAILLLLQARSRVEFISVFAGCAGSILITGALAGLAAPDSLAGTGGVLFGSLAVGASGAAADTGLRIARTMKRSLSWQADRNWMEAAYTGIAAGRLNLGMAAIVILSAYLCGCITVFGSFMGMGEDTALAAGQMMDVFLLGFSFLLVIPFTSLAAGILMTRTSRAQLH